MSYRGRGRVRGRGGYGRGGYAKQLPVGLFPGIEDFEPAGDVKCSESQKQLIKWSIDLYKFWINSSLYYYADRRQRPENTQKPDIERYSDRKLQTKKVRSQLGDFVLLDRDHFPVELVEGGKKRKRVAKKIRWNPDLGHDIFEKFEKMDQAEGEETEKKEDEDDEEEDEGSGEEDAEYSDDGDYGRNEDCDDDDDDVNMADDGDDEPIY